MIEIKLSPKCIHSNIALFLLAKEAYFGTLENLDKWFSFFFQDCPLLQELSYTESHCPRFIIRYLTGHLD